MYACPKHVRTDHPVLVYKTYEIERTVLRLFSCLSLTIEHLSLYLTVLLLNISLLILWINYLHLKYQVVAHCLP